MAQKAPFGKGGETIIDNKVRSAWEIDAGQLIFNGSRWAGFLYKIINKVKPDLGLEDYTVSAHLYKMLIYEKGDFFLPHKDSEKEKGMFGTMVINLPSKHTGGELVVSFEGVKEVVSFAEAAGNFEISYAAFYADCDHEIQPLLSGYRVCLVYNLVQQKSGKKIQLTSIETHAEQMAKIFTNEEQLNNIKPHIVLLGHQYTPESFSISGLKLNDRPKAEALLRAAQKAGCYAKMCLVTSYLSGMPEDSGRYGYGDEGDEDAEMVEVYDESLYIEHWLKNEIPPLSNVRFEEDDLIASFALKDDEPVAKQSTGYMGNYGPDLMHWYHYGAVMIWSRQVNAQLLPQQDTTSKLLWINYFNKNLRQLSDNEITSAELILSTGSGLDKTDKIANYNVIADWIINRKSRTFFLDINPELSQFYFTKIDAAHWLKLLHFLPAEIIEQTFASVTQHITMNVLEQLLTLVRQFSADDKLHQFVISQIKKLPHYLSKLPVKQGQKELPVTSAAVGDLFWIEKKLPQDETWISQIAEILASCEDRNYINLVLAPQLLALNEKTPLAHKLMQSCRQYLQKRVNNQPQPPANWRRQMPSTTGYTEQWKLLKTFLESPDQQVFDFRKNQHERNYVENAISNAVVDLKTETIKTGSPHTLRITKTQAAYHKEVKKWKEDSELLNKIVRKIDG